MKKKVFDQPVRYYELLSDKHTMSIEVVDEKFKTFFPIQIEFMEKIQSYHVQMQKVCEQVSELYDIEYRSKDQADHTRDFFPMIEFVFKMKIKPVELGFRCDRHGTRMEIHYTVCSIGYEGCRIVGCSFGSMGRVTEDSAEKIIKRLKSYHESIESEIRRSILISSALASLHDVYQDRVVCSIQDGKLSLPLDQIQSSTLISRLSFICPGDDSKYIEMSYGGSIYLSGEIIEPDGDYGFGLVCEGRFDTDISDEEKFFEGFKKCIQKYFDRMIAI